MTTTVFISRRRAFLFRITHIDNLPWLLDNGLPAINSGHLDPSFIPIGNQEIIDKRASRQVPIPPGGTLADYVPFYFTPWSPMLYNIQTGLGGVVQRSAEEIVFLVTSAARVEELGLSCLVTDSHAVTRTARFFHMPDGLDEVDWKLLRRRDFRRDPEDPEKLNRYQAEALIHRRVPREALLKLIGGTRDAEGRLESQIRKAGIELDVGVRTDWYFR